MSQPSPQTSSSRHHPVASARSALRELTRKFARGSKDRPHPIVRMLVATLLLATLPLLVAAIILPMRVKSTMADLGNDHLAQVARDLAKFTENDMQGHMEEVRFLASLEPLVGAMVRRDAGTLDPASIDGLNRQLAAILRQMDHPFQCVFLCDATGQLFAGVTQAGESDPLRQLDIRDRAYLAQARETLVPVISDPIRSKLNNKPVIVLLAPIKNGSGTFAGAVGLVLEIEQLSAVITGQKLGQTGYTFAVDRQGVVVAHPDPARVFSRDLACADQTARLCERMRRGETGIEAYVATDGSGKLAAFAPVPLAGWSIAATIDTAELAAPAQSLRRIIFTMIGACVVVAIVMAAVFALGLEKLHQTLDEVRSSEARFKVFASVGDETIWDWNVATNAVWWNDGVKSVLGYQPGEIAAAGADLERFVQPTERALLAGGIHTCLESGAWTGEHHFRRKDGTFAYMLHRIVAVHSPEGAVVRVVGGMTDISARRAVEEKLIQQAALLDQARDSIVMCDLNQVIQYWNRGSERLYGWSAQEALGRRLDVLLGIDTEVTADAMKVAMLRGEWLGQIEKRTKDGAQLTLDCRWSLMRDEQGRPKSILSIGTDITDRLQMEAKFLRAQRLESIGTLAGGIAHDLNNLLSPIVMGVGILNDANLSEADRHVVNLMGQSANRGTHLVKQVLSFARGEEGVRVPVHIGYLTREVESMARSTFPKNISVQVNVPRDLWLIRADPTQLNQVLLNLCVNARDAMPAGGQLAISARNVHLDEQFARLNRETPPGRYVLIEIADTGTGMPKEVLDKIFEPFFTTKDPGRGTGLGLSTVIGIVHSHGGAVNVYSELGRGSVFKVFLPAADDDAAKHDSGTAHQVEMALGNGELVLLVDDEDPILAVTRGALESAGYKAIVARSGAEALALYCRHHHEIAVVLTDLMMPGMDGPTLIAALRSINPNVNIIAASGLPGTNDAARPVDDRIRHFLIKPYTLASLQEALRAALAHQPAEVAAV